MQNKGAIRLFAILLALVCLYQISFTFFTKKVENEALEYATNKAGDEPDLISKYQFQYLDSVANETAYNFLFLRKYTYMECKNREINFGLDLKGGMNLILEVKVADIVRALSNYSQDEKFLEAMHLAELKEKSTSRDFLPLFAEAFKEVAPNGNLSAIFATVDLRDKVKPGDSDEEVLKVLDQESKSAIDNAFNIISTRIDRFGVAQPNVQRLQKAGQILIELPGITEPERVRKLLQGTASLEFWETYDFQEISDAIMSANNIVARLEESKLAPEIQIPLIDEVGETEQQTDTEQQIDTQTELLDSDLLSEKDSDLLSETTDEEINLLTDLDDDSETEPETAGISLFTYLHPSNSPLGPIIGTVAGRDTAKVNSYFHLEQVRAVLPRDLKLLWTVKPLPLHELRMYVPGANARDNYYQLIAIKSTHDGRAPLEGDAVSSARTTTNERGNFSISMSMTSEGSKTWARLTKANAPSNENRNGKAIAIVLDNYVYSHPSVKTEIKGGQSEISGNFTPDEAKDLANILKSGKLPAPARIVEDTVVGPSLGQEAVDAGLTSFFWAFIVIIIYMIVYYGYKAGNVANLALLINLFFIIGIMAAFGAVLTLPGIAGIILTLGIAIDANVLINERIKEELNAGKGIKLAVKDGYKNAFSPIIDANITSVLVGFILFTVGTGPIRGFATTFLIGIFTSFFTAVFVSRLFYIFLLEREQEISFATRISKDLFKNIKIKFLENRHKLLIISGALSILAIGSLSIRGLKPGIDFTGGRTYVVRFAEDVSSADVQTALFDAFGGANVEAKIFGSSNQVRLATNYLFDDPNDEESDKRVESELYTGLNSFLGDYVTKEQFLSNHLMSSQKVGPTIASKTKTNGFIAVILSLIVIFFYIFMRFRNWQYGWGAVVALAHDVLMVLGIYSVAYTFMPFSMEVDQSFIAAILTVVSYSINDKVVVFDRLREYKALYPKRGYMEIVNMSLNASVSRTINTSLTTLLVLIVIFIMGSEVIRGFVFAMIVGITVGTYSTFFIATPIAYNLLKTKINPEPIIEKKKKK
ncbi:MAG: protein translocase subunit SecDF [Marinilabiliaceae bacterium]|nr:protein translocase subunit SecDF [Marinilabiliaceae bacterium]